MEDIMAKFQRTPEMENKMVMDSFGGNVIVDLEVHIIYDHGKSKLRAWSPKLSCFLQFPVKLRIRDKTYICDATEAQNNGQTFYRAYKGTIRNNDGDVIG